LTQLDDIYGLRLNQLRDIDRWRRFFRPQNPLR